jgi:hypothetical protein
MFKGKTDSYLAWAILIITLFVLGWFIIRWVLGIIGG